MTVITPHGMLATSPQALPFGEIVARSYLLETPDGNVMVYSSELGPGDEARIAERGAPEIRLLNHWHEAMFGPNAEILDRIPVTVGDADRAETEARMEVAGTISGRGEIASGLEAIPMPGHTPGATAFLWEFGGLRRLFTGDSLYLGEEGWAAAVLADSDPDAYAESLELLADLGFDVLIPWAGPRRGPAVETVERDEGRRRVLEVAARIRRGGKT